MKERKNFICIRKKSIESVLDELKSLRVAIDDVNIKKRVDKIMKMIDDSQNEQMEPIEKTVYNKMQETRRINEALSMKLYMLYRNITLNKISEEEAKNIYEMYMKTEIY